MPARQAPLHRTCCSSTTALSQQQPSAMAQPAPQRPGLFGQMTYTVAGIAIGSTMGHIIGHGLGASPQSR